MVPRRAATPARAGWATALLATASLACRASAQLIPLALNRPVSGNIAAGGGVAKYTLPPACAGQCAPGQRTRHAAAARGGAACRLASWSQSVSPAAGGAPGA
jgi:hypothetical protein